MERVHTPHPVVPSSHDFPPELETDLESVRRWRFMRAFRESFGDRCVTTAEILAVAYQGAGESDELRLSLNQIAEIRGLSRLSSRGLGRWLAARSFLRVGSMEILPAGFRDHACVWAIVDADQ